MTDILSRSKTDSTSTGERIELKWQADPVSPLLKKLQKLHSPESIGTHEVTVMLPTNLILGTVFSSNELQLSSHQFSLQSLQCRQLIRIDLN